MEDINAAMDVEQPRGGYTRYGHKVQSQQTQYVVLRRDTKPSTTQDDYDTIHASTQVCLEVYFVEPSVSGQSTRSRKAEEQQSDSPGVHVLVQKELAAPRGADRDDDVFSLVPLNV